jgi:hypothetical protein
MVNSTDTGQREDLSPGVVNDEEDVEQLKSGRRYGEKVHRGENVTVIPEEPSPSLNRIGSRRLSRHAS